MRWPFAWRAAPLEPNEAAAAEPVDVGFLDVADVGGAGTDTEELISRGHHAAQLLHDDLLSEVMAGAKREFVRDWLASTDPQAQMAAWAKVHALDAVTAQLNRVISEGEFAEVALRRSS